MFAIGRCLAAALLAAALGACASDSESAAVTPIVTGVALPQGYKVDPDRTLVVGEGDRWSGRLSYNINATADDMVEFMRRQMPAFGWTETSVVRGRTSTLTFQQATTQRVATVQVAPHILFGSWVDMTVAPYTQGQQPRAEIGPAITPAPRESVTSQPLR